MKSLIFAIALTLPMAGMAHAILPPRDVQEMLKPILDLHAEAESAQGERRQVLFWQCEKLTADLLQMRTKSSDEALVVLMNFYVGESLQADLVHSVTVRGRRMLPLLVKYRSAHVTFSRRKYPSSLLLAPDIRKQDFETAIKSVRAGKVIGED